MTMKFKEVSMPCKDGNIEAILTDVGLLADLAPEHMAALAHACSIGSFEKNQAIFRTGDSITDLHFLVSGQVKLALSSHRGEEKVIDVVDAGRSFGEAELFCGHRCLTSAVAIKASCVLWIAAEGVRRVMALDPRVALRVMNLLAQRQIEMENEIAARHFHSGSQRLLNHFVSVSGPFRDPAGETPVTLRTSKQLLASRFDMQPETLSRALRDLAQAGLIAVDTNGIRLINGRVAGYLADDASTQAGVLAAGGHLRGKSGGSCATGTQSSGSPQRSYCDEINRAGRQRMLSQRMAKSWLMLEQRLLPRRAKQVLGQSIELFDQQLLKLETPPGIVDGGSARAELAELWRPYKALLESAPSRKNAHALYGMNEAVLAAAHRLTLGFEAADGTRKGRLLNLAGRQRMLSQRMAKLFIFQHTGIHAAKSRMELEAVSREFSAAFDKIAAATQDKPAIAAELDSVAEHWNTLQSALATGPAASFPAAARKVFAASECLLQRMDMAVELYARTWA